MQKDLSVGSRSSAETNFGDDASPELSLKDGKSEDVTFEDDENGYVRFSDMVLVPDVGASFGRTTGLTAPLANSHFDVVSYNGDKTEAERDACLYEDEDDLNQPSSDSPKLRSLRQIGLLPPAAKGKPRLHQGARWERERIVAALANDDTVHTTTRGANFDLVLRYRPEGRCLVAGFVLRKPPAGWPYPISSMTVWTFREDTPPDVAAYADCCLNEETTLVQDEIPEHLVQPRPLAYIRIGLNEEAIYVPLKKPVLCKYVHIKFISAYNLCAPGPAPHIEVKYVGIAGLCVQPNGWFGDREAEEMTFSDKQPLSIVYGYRPPAQLNHLTESFYDYVHTNRFVYIFPPSSWTSSPHATRYDDLKEIIKSLIGQGTFSSGDLALSFFYGTHNIDMQLAKWCGLWNTDPTIAFIDLRNKEFMVMNNYKADIDTVRQFLMDCITGDHPRQMRPSEFKRLGVLGSGAFGSVFMAEHVPTKEIVAIKVLTGGLVPHEVALLQQCRSCEEIVQCRASFKNEKGGSIWVVMEYCGGGNAWDIVDDTAFDVREEHVATILKAVLKALKFLEENGILHRDIKPDNILFTSSGQIKLTDLGCGRVLEKGDMASSQAGHILTRPPEMLQLGAVYDHRADIWSVGITALILARLLGLMEAMKFKSIDDINRHVDFKRWHVSFKDFVQRCLAPQYNRPHAAELLQHEFILNFAKDNSLFKDYCARVEQTTSSQLIQIQPVLKVFEDIKLTDECTNNITISLQAWASTLRNTGLNERMHSDLERSLKTAMVDHTTRMLVIGGRGDGKSALINALAGMKLCEVGSLERQTMDCKWQELNLGRDTLMIMDSRGNAEYEAPSLIGSLLQSFIMVDKPNPLHLLQDELRKSYPDIIIFVCRAQGLDTKQTSENIEYLREVLTFLRKEYPRRPFPCVLGIASQVDQLDPPYKSPEMKKEIIERARMLLHQRMEDRLVDLFDEATNASISLNGSVLLEEMRAPPKLHTFAVSSVIEWSADGKSIVEDLRWGFEALRKHLTEDKNVRLTLSLITACKMHDKPRLVARAWANYYSQVIEGLLSAEKPVPIVILLAQLVLCTGIITNSQPYRLCSFFEQINHLWITDAANKPGFVYVYRGMLSWKYVLLSYHDLIQRVGEALGEYLTNHLYTSEATFRRLVEILWRPLYY